MDKVKRSVAEIRAQALCSASLEAYTGSNGFKSATESLDDVGKESALQSDIREYVTEQAIDTIAFARCFFSADPEMAYKELVSLLEMQDVRDAVIARLAADAELVKEERLYDDETDDEIAQRTEGRFVARAKQKARKLTRDAKMATIYAHDADLDYRDKYYLDDFIASDTDTEE